MLTILKSNDKLRIRDICRQEGITCDNASVYVAENMGEMLGYVIYTQNDEVCDILAVESMQDAPLFDGLVRSVMFSETANGADKPVRFAKSIDKKLLVQYHFVRDDIYILKSMSDFLNNCKNCKNC